MGYKNGSVRIYQRWSSNDNASLKVRESRDRDQLRLRIDNDSSKAMEPQETDHPLLHPTGTLFLEREDVSKRCCCVSHRHFSKYIFSIMAPTVR